MDDLTAAAAIFRSPHRCYDGFILSWIWYYKFALGQSWLYSCLTLTYFSVVGVLSTTLITINLTTWVVKLHVGALVISLGLNILLYRRKNMPFSRWWIAGLGWLEVFNKGISGGSYSPVVPSEEGWSGVRGRNAVGITSLAEGITSIVGVSIYLISDISLNSLLLISLGIGAVLSVPLSAYLVSRLPAGRLTYIIGGLSTALGGYTLIRLLI